MKSNQKGITLVALVVTIVVLLILAGVSISLVVGQNGIITRAQAASKNTTADGTTTNALLLNMEKKMNEELNPTKVQ